MQHGHVRHSQTFASLLQDLAFDSEPQDAPCDASGGDSGYRESRAAAPGDALGPDNSRGLGLRLDSETQIGLDAEPQGGALGSSALGLRLDSETQVGVDAEPQGEAMGSRGFSLGLRLDSETQPDLGLGEAQPAVRPLLALQCLHIFLYVLASRRASGQRRYQDILWRSGKAVAGHTFAT